MPFRRQIEPPTDAAVSIEDLREYLRVNDDTPDAEIEASAAAAVAHIENLTGRAIMTQGWELVLDGFPPGTIRLPVGPVQSLDSLTYLDGAGVERSLSAALTNVDAGPIDGRVTSISGWPATANRTGTVTLRWTAGEAVCPPDLAAAIKLLAGHFYANREGVVTGMTATEMPLGVSALVQRHRRFVG